MSYNGLTNDRNLIAVVNSTDNGLSYVGGINGAMKVTQVTPITTSTEDLKVTIRIPVTQTDVTNDNTNYKDGSQGLVKTIKMYKVGAISSDPATLVTYKYENATYGYFYTQEIESVTTVA